MNSGYNPYMTYYAATKNKGKKYAQSAHAKRRAAERYNVVVSSDDLKTVVQRIQSGRCTLLQKQSNRVSLFDVDIHGTVYRVVYDKKRHSIVTFLPKGDMYGD